MSVDRSLFRYPPILVPDPDEPPAWADAGPDPDYVDDVAVERACDGHRVVLNRLERVEAVRRLHTRGLSDVAIAGRIGITERTVCRIRQRHRIRARQAQSA